jgi:copper oxidase (laccase) domain-containing protein
VVGRAVEALIKDGSAADRLIAAIGPSIRVCCYRVSDDLGIQFRRQFGEEIAPRDSQGFRLDLPGAVRHTLVKLGVPARHIEVLPHCTACDAGRFFSHRRDGGRTGRHIAFAVCAF